MDGVHGFNPERDAVSGSGRRSFASSARLDRFKLAGLVEFLGLLEDFVDSADHVERLLGQGVAFAVDDHLEAADGFLQRHILARRTGKHFGHVEGLRQETLDFAGAGHSLLVFRREFVHAQNGDDVAQFLVALQNALHRAGGGVVLFADDVGVDLTAGGIQRIDRRVDAQRGDVAAQHHGGVEVIEGGCGRRVGQVVRRHVHGLDGGDGAGLGGGDALLQLAHFVGQRRLVAHGRRHTAQQRGHFGTGQGVAVDVVHEEQNVTAFVAETLGHGQAGQRHAQAVARGFVHLTEHHAHLVEDVGVLHFVIEVIAFAGALTHTGEYRQAAVLLGDVVDELHHVHGLPHAGAAEQADLAALGERADQVDHLDAGFEQIDRRRQIIELRRGLVNRAALVGGDGAGFVDGAAQHVHDATQHRRPHRDLNGMAGVVDQHAPTQAIAGAHGNGAHHAVTDLLLYLESEAAFCQTAGVVVR